MSVVGIEIVEMTVEVDADKSAAGASITLTEGEGASLMFQN